MPRAKASKAAAAATKVALIRLTVNVPREVRDALRMRADDNNIDMGDVIADVLRRELSVELKHLAAMRRELASA